MAANVWAGRPAAAAPFDELRVLPPISVEIECPLGRGS
jgi:hypothetical protein